MLLLKTEMSSRLC